MHSPYTEVMQPLTAITGLAAKTVTSDGATHAGGGAYEISPYVTALIVAAALILYVIMDWLFEAPVIGFADMPGGADDPRTPEQQYEDDAHASVLLASTKRSRIFTCTG